MKATGDAQRRNDKKKKKFKKKKLNHNTFMHHGTSMDNLRTPTSFIKIELRQERRFV